MLASVFLLVKHLLNAKLKKGYCPMGFGLSVVLPELKDSRKSLSDPSNYRPLSIIPIFAKIP